MVTHEDAALRAGAARVWSAIVEPYFAPLDAVSLTPLIRRLAVRATVAAAAAQLGVPLDTGASAGLLLPHPQHPAAQGLCAAVVDSGATGREGGAAGTRNSIRAALDVVANLYHAHAWQVLADAVDATPGCDIDPAQGLQEAYLQAASAGRKSASVPLAPLAPLLDPPSLVQAAQVALHPPRILQAQDPEPEHNGGGDGVPISVPGCVTVVLQRSGRAVTAQWRLPEEEGGEDAAPPPASPLREGGLRGGRLETWNPVAPSVLAARPPLRAPCVRGV